MEKEKKDPRLSDEVVKLQKHRIMLWCAIIIIAFFLIVQFTVANCGNKVLADQFTFASTISSIILSVIAIIMSVVSGESINNLLHKFRDVHDEISDVPDKIDSSIQKMDDASGKFEGIYDNLRETPQKIEESTKLMQDVSNHVDGSIEKLFNLLAVVQSKTESLDLIRDDVRKIKEGLLESPVVEESPHGSNILNKKQIEEISISGSPFGALLLYAIKLAKDMNKQLSLTDLVSVLGEPASESYFYGYYIASMATGMFAAREIVKRKVFEIHKYDNGLNSLREKLVADLATDQNKLVERIGLVEKLIENALPIEDVKDK